MSSPLSRFDRAGVLLSALCAAHCVLGLFIVAILGVGGGLLLHPAIHQAGLVFATVIAAIGIGLGLLRHRRIGPFVVAAAGLALMAGGIAAGHGTYEVVLTVIGVSLVAVGHLLNLRAR